MILYLNDDEKMIVKGACSGLLIDSFTDIMYLRLMDDMIKVINEILETHVKQRAVQVNKTEHVNYQYGFVMM